jgi:hypothetical protein
VELVAALALFVAGIGEGVVIPAKAGIQERWLATHAREHWIPAFAGMTDRGLHDWTVCHPLALGWGLAWN